MDRLYLIRVDMERFLGPFTLKQVKESYSRMEFGLQDEICGSLRQWVTFDDIEGIRRHYPELVQLVQTEMLSGWGMSTHSVGPGPQVNVKMPTKKERKRRPWILFLACFGVSAMGFLFVLLQQDGQLGKLGLFLRDRTYFTALSLYGEGYNARFEAHMDRNRDAINQAMKKRKGFGQWIPLVRAVAFEKDGRWDGLSAKRLRGRVDESLPQDCSMGAWEQRWVASREQWSRFLEGRDLPSQEWASILTLDPHWIRLRSPMNGWIRPGSYHEGCLIMAMRALQRQQGVDTSWEAKVFHARLRWQLGFINGQSLNEDFEMSGTLWALSCIEDSHERTELANCSSSLSLRPEWRERLEQGIVRKKIQLLVSEHSQLDEGQLAELSQLLAELEKKPMQGWLDFTDEIGFYREILRLRGDIAQARIEIRRKSPHLRFP